MAGDGRRTWSGFALLGLAALGGAFLTGAMQKVAGDVVPSVQPLMCSAGSLLPHAHPRKGPVALVIRFSNDKDGQVTSDVGAELSEMGFAVVQDCAALIWHANGGRSRPADVLFQRMKARAEAEARGADGRRDLPPETDPAAANQPDIVVTGRVVPSEGVVRVFVSAPFAFEAGRPPWDDETGDSVIPTGGPQRFHTGENGVRFKVGRRQIVETLPQIVGRDLDQELWRFRGDGKGGWRFTADGDLTRTLHIARVAEALSGAERPDVRDGQAVIDAKRAVFAPLAAGAFYNASAMRAADAAARRADLGAAVRMLFRTDFDGPAPAGLKAGPDNASRDILREWSALRADCADAKEFAFQRASAIRHAASPASAPPAALSGDFFRIVGDLCKDPAMAPLAQALDCLQGAEKPAGSCSREDAAQVIDAALFEQWPDAGQAAGKRP